MDKDTQALLNRAYEEWRRRKFGVAAIGCALVLAGCGGGEDEEATAPDASTLPVSCAASGVCK